MASVAVLFNMISFMMIGKINERSPERERISYFRWGTEVRTRFKQLYPEVGQIDLLDSSYVMMILCFIFLGFGFGYSAGNKAQRWADDIF